ncbi:PREDICTED: uncharacterized protein LOC108760110 [Trachymyrmex cornetzi]|uniref:uncharacterized protein LOC108760110 n=1 Tax=Trachymyrmex cornetzi TaxID=471704 RepID=UPI00084F4C12|nr:PREDICTED: uncharacterized protein LOC108760110 [Trachymyrmex cornetzi]
MSRALARITANIGSPGERRRKMYATVVMSMVLYGAPIWAQTVARDRVMVGSVRKLQRQLALRVIRGYRTISHDAAAIISGMVPFDLVADRIRRSYLRRRDILARDGVVTPQVGGMLLEVERRRSIERWQRRLSELPPSGPGAIVRGAIGEDLETATSDTAAHTHLFCPSWAEQREGLLAVVGIDRTFRAVVRAIMRSPEAWHVFAEFCETVMRRKEEDERARERGLVPRVGVLALSPNEEDSDSG